MLTALFTFATAGFLAGMVGFHRSRKDALSVMLALVAVVGFVGSVVMFAVVAL